MTSLVTIPPSVVEVFDHVSAKEPGREALVTRSGRWSYGRLDTLCNRAAAALRSLGLRPGDRIAGCLPNDIDVVIAFHGAMRLGAVWLGINRVLAPPEKRYLIEDSGASLLLCDEVTAAEIGGLPNVRVVIAADDGGEWRDAVTGAFDESGLQFGPVDPFAAAGIAYTSGTTGRPKGAVHSQYNMVMAAATVALTRGYGASLRKGDCLALTILNMQIVSSLVTAVAGGCAVVMDRNDPRGVADWIHREQVTVWNAPPALLQSFVTDDLIAAGDLATLEHVVVGGGPCPEPLRDAFAKKFGKPVLTTYGLSELPTTVSTDDPDGGHVLNASGRPLPHLSVRIVDGEICVAPQEEGPWAGAYRFMLEYLGHPEETADVLRGGLLHTGDLGYLDEHGYLHVEGRRTLVILRGGGNVYPAEIERVVSEHPAVAECAILGIPDERLGERVVGVVEVVHGSTLRESELFAHCSASLATYKVPESWRFVDKLPRNAMGKVVRHDLVGLFGGSWAVS